MNHIADANKMVSDTPRTDAEYERLFEIYQNAERINGPLCCAFENDMRLCRQLERELNAANERIKCLIEERDRANRLADWKWNLRGEFESLLGTDKIEEGIEAVKALNERIKRLEEAGEKMVDEPLRKHRRWILNEAKEAKP